MKEENYKLVELNSERAIYEGGWWVARKDFDFSQERKNSFQTPLGWDRNEETKQLTYFFLP